jgi:hypothetical protein
MNVVVQNHYSFITTNGYLFTSKESDIGYNLLKPWNDLFLAADERGIKMYTPDQFNENEADLLILMDYPSQPVPESKRTFFLIYEPDMLIPKNWNKTFHDHCDKVFTWDDRLVDNHKYFKHNFTTDLQDARPLELTREQFMLRKPIVLMQTRKQNDHPNSLYGKRDNIIRFFEGKASGMFDLWGRNWGGFPSWRGAATNKLEVLKNYRFCIAFENCNHARGYITEKMLDCLLAGVVPVYWGAPNVTDHVPAECFIDMRRFKFYEDLLEFLNDITYDDYMKYMVAMHDYIASPQAEQFYNTHFVDMMIKHMEAV